MMEDCNNGVDLGRPFVIFSFLSKGVIRAVIVFLSLFFVCHVTGAPVFAQQQEPSFGDTSSVQETPQGRAASEKRIFETKLRVADAVTIMAGDRTFHLWGIEAIEGMGAGFKTQARVALENIISGAPAQCEVKDVRGKAIFVQCISANDLDLGLFMLQQGYVTADRSSVYGTVFESAYLQAEEQARRQALGVWSAPRSELAAYEGRGTSLWFGLGLAFLLSAIIVFAVLAVMILRGFEAISKVQSQNMEMLSKERKLRDKERGIVAMMLDSELKSNKAKIEAYLVVYREVLQALENPERTPKYKKAGDIVQRQPALDRVVFDRNTDKLDILGDRLSSEIIHFYARIKSKPDYINIEPDMALEEVIGIVNKAIENAERMNKIAEHLIDLFSEGGMSSADMGEDSGKGFED